MRSSWSLTIGGAAVYEKHGNFIINKNNASAEDIKKLITYIHEYCVQEKSESNYKKRSDILVFLKKRPWTKAILQRNH